MAPMLSLDDVELYYDHVYALKGVSIDLDAGETVALIGANGAGKSSILRAITGLSRIRKGSITFEGTAHRRPRPGGDRQARHRHGPRGAPGLPLHDRARQPADGRLLAFGRGRRSAPRSTTCCTAFPASRIACARPPDTMSGGEQQMLVIGRALMAKPRLLLLDEPSLGVAPKIVQDIARSIVAINRDEKVSVLLVEQNSRMALRVSHRAYALSTGSIALAGLSADLVKDERVQHLYLGGEV